MAASRQFPLSFAVALLASSLVHLALGWGRLSVDQQTRRAVPATAAGGEVIFAMPRPGASSAPQPNIARPREPPARRPRQAPRTSQPAAPPDGTGQELSAHDTADSDESAVETMRQGAGASTESAGIGGSSASAGPAGTAASWTAPVPSASNSAPTYPRSARVAGIEGNVLARVLVQADGHVSDVEILEGAALFHDRVRETLLRWRYLPATAHGRPVPARWTVSIPFALK
jgi:periplasmic protein TonB